MDSDARLVEVELIRGALGLEHIVIRDNGEGMTRENAPDLFSKLGDSWKRRRGHCNADVGRSPTTAYAILCDRMGANPEACSNRLLAAHVDNALGRNSWVVAALNI